MNFGILSGIVTGVLIMVFVGMVLWAYSPRRRERFDTAARVPLEEDQTEPQS